ncbi:hypothetical protein [Paenibacillus sp. OV219]|uniref:hypothetical protein n=1 Tax=Paenibacillus sp. OV219 TaxID=1884377 RepID=UPI0008D31C0A|nr:hypothetical protein [Paenibacillus sp. OV219]SEP18902.1 hypothetical protein SAMN05518847_1292 [Paenibacillus sp. OV219]
MQLTKLELVELLINAEQYISKQNNTWIKSQFKKHVSEKEMAGEVLKKMPLGRKHLFLDFDKNLISFQSGTISKTLPS